MIVIQKPYITDDGKTARLCADIDRDGAKECLWLEVVSKYGKYLCAERADAFLVGMLHWAMAKGEDIRSEAPVSEDLLFQLKSSLVPALAKNSVSLHAIRIEAPTEIAPLPNAGAVGTGISCGVDSFHVLAEYSDPPPEFKDFRLTHLMLHNVGSYGAGDKGRALYREHKEHVQRFAAECGFEVIFADSDLQDLFPEHYFYCHAFRGAFAILALQKLWHIYFYASSGHDDVSHFSLVNNDLFGCARYEMLSLSALSNRTLRIYQGGATVSRLEKLRKVVDYPPSYRYLTACGHTPHNCNKCIKCRRTILELYATDALEKYRAVFDVDYFYAHKTWYFVRYLSKYWQHNSYFVEIYPLLKNRIPLKDKVLAFITYTPQVLYRNFQNWRKNNPKGE